MKYFELTDDINYPKRWYLQRISDVDGTEFVQAPMLSIQNPFREQVFNVEMLTPGVAMDFTTTNYRNVPIVSFKFIKAMSGVNGFTAFPATIVGARQTTSYYILHVWNVVDCFDEARSSYEVIPKNDPIRPDLAGNYRYVTKARINPARVADQDLFRIARLESRLVVSEAIKNRLEGARVKGVIFNCLSDD